MRLETDASGQVVREHTYEPFGSELGTPDLTGNRFRFTGEHTEASGLIFLRARVYDPETGTFLSVEPTPAAGSAYRYCLNNPLMFVDPSGIDAWSDVTPGLKGLYN
ncbi:MAG: RHS repeat-associated core domain-containing protein [Thermoleophilia bacterium]